MCSIYTEAVSSGSWAYMATRKWELCRCCCCCCRHRRIRAWSRRWMASRGHRRWRWCCNHGIRASCRRLMLSSVRRRWRRSGWTFLCTVLARLCKYDAVPCLECVRTIYVYVTSRPGGPLLHATLDSRMTTHTLTCWCGGYWRRVKRTGYVIPS